MPLSSIIQNPNFMVGVTSKGGHVQYFGGCGREQGLGKYIRGMLLPNDRWFGKACCEYIQFLDEFKEAEK